MKVLINFQLTFALLAFLGLFAIAFETDHKSRSNILERLADEKIRLNQTADTFLKKVQQFETKNLWKRYVKKSSLSSKLERELNEAFPNAAGFMLVSSKGQMIKDTFTKMMSDRYGDQLFYQHQFALKSSSGTPIGKLYLYSVINLNADRGEYSIIYSESSGFLTANALPESSYSQLLDYLLKMKKERIVVQAIQLNGYMFYINAILLNENHDRLILMKRPPQFFQLWSFYVSLIFTIAVLYLTGQRDDIVVYDKETEDEDLIKNTNAAQAQIKPETAETKIKQVEPGLQKTRDKVFNPELKSLIKEISRQDFDYETTKNALNSYLTASIDKQNADSLLISAINQKENTALYDLLADMRAEYKAHSAAFLCFSSKLLSFSCEAQSGLTIYDQDNFFLNIDDSIFNTSNKEVTEITFDKALKENPFMRKRFLQHTLDEIRKAFFIPLQKYHINGFLFFSFSYDTVTKERILPLTENQYFKDFLIAYRFSKKEKKFIRRTNSSAYLRREAQISLSQSKGQLRIDHLYLSEAVSVVAFQKLFSKIRKDLQTGERVIMQTPNHLTFILNIGNGTIRERFRSVLTSLKVAKLENLEYPHDGQVLLSYL